MPTKYYFRNDPEIGFTPSQVKKMGKAKQLDIMETWFRTYFEDPGNETPYESKEGGFQYIWGGPYDADEQLQHEFAGIISLDRIQELAEELTRENWQWAPTHMHSDRRDEGQEEPNDRPPYEPNLDEIVRVLEAGAVPTYGDEYEIGLRKQVNERLDALEKAVRQLGSRPAGLGHNGPPGAIDADEQPLSDQTQVELLEAVREIQSQLAQPKPDALKVGHSAQTISTIGHWLAAKLDKAVDKAIDVGVPVAIGVATAHATGIAAMILSALKLTVEWLSTVSMPF